MTFKMFRAFWVAIDNDKLIPTSHIRMNEQGRIFESTATIPRGDNFSKSVLWMCAPVWKKMCLPLSLSKTYDWDFKPTSSIWNNFWKIIWITPFHRCRRKSLVAMSFSMRAIQIDLKLLKAINWIQTLWSASNEFCH